MRSNLVHMLVPLAFAVGACGGGASDADVLSDDLRNDLAAASSAKLELANTSGDFKPMRFVSDIEQTNGSTPVQRAPSPRPVVARAPSVAPVPEEAPPPPEAPPTPEAPPEVVADAPEEAQPEVSAVPMVAPRPSALPVDVPSTQVADRGMGRGGVGTGRGNDGVGIGGVIGVVIRGGGVGPDHCPPRRRGVGRRPPFPILP